MVTEYNANEFEGVDQEIKDRTGLNMLMDPLFYKGLGQFLPTVGKDYWNTAMSSAAGVSDFIPGLNLLNPGEFFMNRMFRDEEAMESDPTFDIVSDREIKKIKNDPYYGPLLEDMMAEGVTEDEAVFMFKAAPFMDPDATWTDWLKAAPGAGGHMLKQIGNEIFQPSLVDDFNPYAEGFGKARMWANIAPQVANLYLTRGTGAPIAGVSTLMNKLSPKLRVAVQQGLPVTTGAPNKWSKFGRNMVLQTPTNPLNPWGMNFSAEAAEPSNISDSWDRDPVVFDDVMTEKIQNFKPTPRGPGPWNEFKG
tara:strand:- start:293 stop:1213 length:921 start_codon:yes stop_codon:yes gene_type:complete